MRLHGRPAILEGDHGTPTPQPTHRRWRHPWSQQAAIDAHPLEFSSRGGEYFDMSGSSTRNCSASRRWTGLYTPGRAGARCSISMATRWWPTARPEFHGAAAQDGDRVLCCWSCSRWPTTSPWILGKTRAVEALLLQDGGAVILAPQPVGQRHVVSVGQHAGAGCARGLR